LDSASAGRPAITRKSPKDLCATGESGWLARAARYIGSALANALAGHTAPPCRVGTPRSAAGRRAQLAAQFRLPSVGWLRSRKGRGENPFWTQPAGDDRIFEIRQGLESPALKLQDHAEVITKKSLGVVRTGKFKRPRKIGHCARPIPLLGIGNTDTTQRHIIALGDMCCMHKQGSAVMPAPSLPIRRLRSKQRARERWQR